MRTHRIAIAVAAGALGLGLAAGAAVVTTQTVTSSTPPASAAAAPAWMETMHGQMLAQMPADQSAACAAMHAQMTTGSPGHMGSAGHMGAGMMSGWRS